MLKYIFVLFSIENKPEFWINKHWLDKVLMYCVSWLLLSCFCIFIFISARYSINLLYKISVHRLCFVGGYKNSLLKLFFLYFLLY